MCKTTWCCSWWWKIQVFCFVQTIIDLQDFVRSNDQHSNFGGSTIHISSDSTYSITPYFIKKCKIHNPIIIDKIEFGVSINVSWFMIKNAFHAFKNQWWILKGLPMLVYKSLYIIMAHCVVHNFCELHDILELIVHDINL